MKVTDEMIATARDASIALNGQCSTYLETKASLEAVLALIDPVPDHVHNVRDVDGALWRRRDRSGTTWTRPGRDYSIQDLVRIFGPLTWEGKSE